MCDRRKLIGLLASWLILSGAGASEAAPPSSPIRVNISGEPLSELLDSLGKQLGYTIGIAPAIAELRAPDMYLAPDSVEAAFEMIAAAYGVCALVVVENKVVHFMSCDVADRMRAGSVSVPPNPQPPRVEWFGLDVDDFADGEIRGVLVKAINPERGASSATGIEAGDVILNIDGKAVTGVAGLVESARDTRTGEWAAILVLRRGEPMNVNVRLVAGE